MKRTFELVIPADDYWDVKETLEKRASFVRRTRIEDIYFESPSGDLARLRKQDTLSRLASTRPLPDGPLETIVLDHRACRSMLKDLGFRERETLAVTRDIYRYRHFALHLDKVRGLGSFLVIEADAGKKPRGMLEKAARRLLRQFGLEPEEGLKPLRTAIDITGALPYTDAIKVAPLALHLTADT